tara:strand:+ start:3571 stop:4800 length:1230 start_codon:yes stop_codon:yes gene_type:complete
MTWENILKDKPLLDMRRINNLYSPYIAYHVAGLIESELYGKLRTIPYNEKISDALEYCISFDYNEFAEEIFSGSKGDYGIADKEAEGLYNDGKKFGGKFTLKVRWEKPMYQFEGVEEVGKKLDGVELDIEYEGSWAKNYQGVKLGKGQNVKNFKINASSIKKQLDEALEGATIKHDGEEYGVMLRFLDKPDFKIKALQDLIGRAYMDYGGTIGDDPARSYPNYNKRPTSKTKKESWRSVLRTSANFGGKGRRSDKKVDAYMKALDIDNDPESIADMQSGKKLIQNDVEIAEGISVDDFYKIMDKANVSQEKLEEEEEEADAEGRDELIFYLQGEMSSLGKLDLNITVPNLEERNTKRSRYGYIDGTYTPLTFNEYMELENIKAKQHIFEIEKVKEGFMKIFEEVKTLGE